MNDQPQCKFYLNRPTGVSPNYERRCNSYFSERGCPCCPRSSTVTDDETTPLLNHEPTEDSVWCPSLGWWLNQFSGEWRSVRRVCSLLLIGFAVWGTAWAVGGSVAAPLKGQLFCLGLLSVLAQIAGWLAGLLRLPPLLGMLLTGILLRNLGVVVFTGDFIQVEAILRNVALVIILLRAGLGLDSAALRRLGLMVARLAIIPSLVEVLTSAVMSHFLFGLPWVWSFLLGSVLAAVSPAVVVPCLLNLQTQGFGVGQGIPTLIIAAASFDDVIGIAIFRIILGIIFASGDLVIKILQGPFSIVYGLVFGVVWGLLLKYFPTPHDTHVSGLRTVLLGVGCLLAIFGSNSIGYDGAGPLGCVVAAFVAGQGWRQQGWVYENNPVTVNYAVLWSIFQPILFGLIGTEIDLSVLNLPTVGLGIACLSVSLSVRLLVSVLIAAGGELNWKERLFVALAWFPKATVQAAIGPVALDMARKHGLVEDESRAYVVLVVAVLAILVTAPLGSIFITLLGPKLLTMESQVQPISEEQRVQIVVNDGGGM